MRSIAVTGASGAVGRRLVDALVRGGEVARVVAIDRRPARSGERSPTEPSSSPDADRSESAEPTDAGLGQTDLETERLDVTVDDLDPVLDGVDSVVHLVEDRSHRNDARAAVAALDRVLDAASAGGCGHAVVLSSALVYGARPDNPVPLTEAQPVDPIPALSYAVVKAEVEERALSWAAGPDRRLALLRPAAALSEGDSSWIGSALRAATAVRPEQVDPPFQFLHHDDLASALALAAVEGLDGIYNVAPDGWIESSEFRRLRGEADLRLSPRVAAWRFRAARMLADQRLLDGLEPYVTWPWVVSNDRLRAAGWAPVHSSQEAFVAGTPPSFLGLINPQRRQEIALGVASSLGAAALGVAAWTARSTASRFRR